jgi:hypothetical protein
MPTSRCRPAPGIRRRRKDQLALRVWLPLDQAAPHRNGNRSERRPRAADFSADGAGSSAPDFRPQPASARPVLETGAITQPNPMSLHRLALWKQARIRVAGRPDWLFIKLHCHSMDPTQKMRSSGDPSKVSRTAGERSGREKRDFALCDCPRNGQHRSRGLRRQRGQSGRLSRLSLPTPSGSAGLRGTFRSGSGCRVKG